MAMPNKYSAIDASLYPRIAHLFFWWSLVSGLIVIINGIFLSRLAQQWSRGIHRRILWSVLLLSGIATTSSFVIWIKTKGLWQISPYFAEVGTRITWHGGVGALLMVAILVTTLAYRMSADHKSLSEESPIIWRVNPRKYYHEWRLVLLPLALVIMGLFIYDSYRNWLLYKQVSARFQFTFYGLQQFSFKFLVDQFSEDPVFLLWLALLLLAVQRTFSRRTDPKNPQTALPRIDRVKFVAIWLATAAFTVSGVLTLVWMSFGLWFNPWFGSR